MPPPHGEKQLCGICLAGGADAPAPCGFDAARFHKECLRKWWRTAPHRCPHCNAREWPLRPVLSSLLKSDTEDCWARGPARAGFCRGQLHGQREEDAVRGAVRDVIAAMRPAAVRVDAVDATLTRFLVCADADATRELEVGLQRTAWAGAGGRVVADGFELTVVRRRVSARCRA